MTGQRYHFTAITSVKHQAALLMLLLLLLLPPWLERELRNNQERSTCDLQSMPHQSRPLSWLAAVVANFLLVEPTG